MTRFLISRLLQSIPVVFGVVSLVFLLVHLIPGDPVDQMLGELASVEDRQSLRAELGLDAPLLTQYGRFWSELAQGSLGKSFSREQNVSELIAERIGPSAWLAVASLLIACFFSFPLALIAASKRGTRWDALVIGLSLLGMSVPIFVIAPLAVLIASIKLRWLPVSGGGDFVHLILPALCLGIVLSGSLVRMIRASLLDSMSEDFVRTARAKGLGWPTILAKHVLRNAMIPVITLLGNMFGGLLAGAVLTETLFDWPGIGKLFFQAFQARDYPLIQGIVLWIALLYVFINILIDVLYSWADPRVRLVKGSA